MIVGKYYPSILTQFIIGCTCYALSFFILKDLITSNTYDQYKYHILALIGIDSSFLLYYQIHSNKNSNRLVVTYEDTNKSNTKLETTTTTEPKSSSQQSISLTSELNDIKITHDISFSGDESECSLFSTPKENKPIQVNKKIQVDKPNKLVQDNDTKKSISDKSNEDHNSQSDAIDISLSSRSDQKN